jgi:gluconate 5-dehydrogenase
MDQFNLAGKRALITGSGQGLGLTMARGLATAGAEVIINDINHDRATAAAHELRLSGLSAYPLAFDVTDQAAVRIALEKGLAEIGQIDILINNAGIHRYGSLESLSLTDWNRVLDTNLTGAFITTQVVAAAMIKRQYGKIINICSLMSEAGRPTTGNYMAAKGGLKMLTKAMAVEWGRYGIQANGIGPGYILSEMTQHLAAKPEFDSWVKQRTPAGRWGTPEDLVGAAIFLASPASNFVNGQILYVDGGFLSSL